MLGTGATAGAWSAAVAREWLPFRGTGSFHLGLPLSGFGFAYGAARAWDALKGWLLMFFFGWRGFQNWPPEDALRLKGFRGASRDAGMASTDFQKEAASYIYGQQVSA